MKITYFNRETEIETDFIFRFNDITLHRTEIETDDIDFVIFPSVRISVGVGSIKSNDFFRNELRNHSNFDFSKKNPHIPVLFYHRHEFILDEEYSILLKIVGEELGISPEKIIVLDSCILPRKNTINPPKFIQLRQYHINTSEYDISKTKKFAFLINKNNKLRSQIFDKIITIYDRDVNLLRKDNIISFRNYSFENNPQGPSENILEIQQYIQNSLFYKFQNDYDFYKTLELPWVIDDFTIGHEYQKMYKNQHEMYSECYYSLIIETGFYYLSFEYPQKIEHNMAFSEKGLTALASGNLPFVIHYSQYYNELERAGFDFSYLQTIFGINYKENTLKQNFDSVDTFISYFKNNTIETINKDYQTVKHIVKHNKDLINKIQNRIPNDEVFEFFNKIKQEKQK